MKKRYIRTAIIVALVILLAGVLISKINIEPAAPATPPPDETISVGEKNEPTSLPSEEKNGAAEEAPETVTLTPEATPAETPEATPAATPETTPTVTPEVTPAETPEATPAATPAATPTVTPEVTPAPTPEATPAPIPEVTPAPEEPERHICTIAIRCDTVADTSKLENPAVVPYIPSNGTILGNTEVEFAPGESVFDILLRVTREHNIHMEFRDDALYSGKYIQGINYLYEYDGGPLSGWMYKVNGQFPNYGCAAYEVKDGDSIVWVYTCDLGMDVGDNSQW